MGLRVRLIKVVATRYDPTSSVQLRCSDVLSIQLQEIVPPEVNIEDLALDFTIPGYDIELRVRFFLPPSPIALLT